ncbi:thiW protein [Thermanaerovibrio velox DSM 12556]|uniref:ThiW protein n=1 Tax=Thermanaerovibrio velox DSM 12556 TaxID=926567 RepID=H0UN20_9BACT|nr:energy coupling factor transporter S component ThiW [Thermanaerovibrio velox]EHM09299.1 thiW protein [Thermanaerovibrio velox DSM 12556]
MMIHETTKKLALAGLMVGIAVGLSGFWFPLGPAKCYPIQHGVNVLAGVLLGPWWAAGCAAAGSAIRVAMGTGTLFAFPGSIPGALMAGLGARLFSSSRQPLGAAAGEVIGTCMVGAYLASAVVGPAIGKDVSFPFLALGFAASSVPGSLLGALTAHRARKKEVLGDLRRPHGVCEDN